jgi:hypothetical protein
MEQETCHKRLSKPSYTYLNKFEFENKNVEKYRSLNIEKQE